MTNKPNRILVLLVIALLLTNIGMLYYYTNVQKDVKQEDDVKSRIEWVQSTLKLDDTQLKQYLDLRATRDSIMSPLYEELRTAKMKMVGYYKLPVGAVPDSVLKATVAEIDAKQQPVELAVYNHFRRLQAICRPEQLPLFDSMMIKLAIRNSGGKEGKKRD